MVRGSPGRAACQVIGREMKATTFDERFGDENMKNFTTKIYAISSQLLVMIRISCGKMKE